MNHHPNNGRATSPVGCLVFKTSEVLRQRLVGSTPTSSAKSELSKSDLTLPRVYKSID